MVIRSGERFQKTLLGQRLLRRRAAGGREVSEASSWLVFSGHNSSQSIRFLRSNSNKSQVLARRPSPNALRRMEALIRPAFERRGTDGRVAQISVTGHGLEARFG